MVKNEKPLRLEQCLAETGNMPGSAGHRDVNKTSYIKYRSKHSTVFGVSGSEILSWCGVGTVRAMVMFDAKKHNAHPTSNTLSVTNIYSHPKAPSGISSIFKTGKYTCASDKENLAYAVAHLGIAFIIRLSKIACI